MVLCPVNREDLNPMYLVCTRNTGCHNVTKMRFVPHVEAGAKVLGDSTSYWTLYLHDSKATLVQVVSLHDSALSAAYET